MHSNKEKWEYYKKISGELFKIISDNRSKGANDIIEKMSEHLDNYSDKSPYRLAIKVHNEDNARCMYVMFDGKSFMSKELFTKEFHIKNIVRNIKIDELLGDDDFNLLDE